MYFKHINNIPELYQVYDEFKHLDNYYPEFQNWYYNKLIPSVINGKGTALVLMDRNQMVGMSLFKPGKLQASRIFPKYQNKGQGIRLLDRTFKEMNNDKPFVTISEEMFHQYSRIFINRYNFSIPKVEKGIYRPGKLEYLFNDIQNLKSKTPY